MKKVVVYFHGYNSSPHTDKVARLSKESSFFTYAFPIHIDPRVACEELTDKIDNLLVEMYNQDIKLIFVGTSLGGWWASKLASEYDCEAVVINPSANPKESLAKYGVPEHILEQYEEIVIPKKATYFFASNDEVIDHTDFIEKVNQEKTSVYIFQEGNHRFNGKHFEKVIEHLKMI